MNENDECINLPVKFFDSYLFNEDRPKTRSEAFLDLVRKASRIDKAETRLNEQRIEYRFGEQVASLRYLAERWQWGKTKVAGFLDELIEKKLITKRTADGTTQTIITICKYERFVHRETQNTPKNGQSADSDKTVIRQNKNIKSSIKRIVSEGEKVSPLPLDEREFEFKKKVLAFSNMYDTPMLLKFLDYWTEKSENGRKMRFEKETVFEISKRLRTWESREQSKFPKQQNNKINTSAN